MWRNSLMPGRLFWGLLVLFLAGAAPLRAADNGPFPSAFDRDVFCAVAVPTVSKTIGKSWSAMELAGRFRRAVDTVFDEGHKRGLSDPLVTQALDRETVRQTGMIAGGQKARIDSLYKFCG